MSLITYKTAKDPRKLSLSHAVDRDLSLFSGFDSEPQPDCLGDGDYRGQTGVAVNGQSADSGGRTFARASAR